jgi:hypothetical protein
VLDNIIKAFQAGDTIIGGMGGFTAMVLSMAAGMSITQVVKFPIARLIPDAWCAWSIRLVGIGATWSIARLIVSLPFPLPIVTALVQPLVYTAGMAMIRHFWPWLEAGKLLGSAAPSDAALQAKAARDG